MPPASNFLMLLWVGSPYYLPTWRILGHRKNADYSMKPLSILVTTLACVCASIEAPCQTPVPPPAPEAQLLSPAELDQLLGPIALYPDPLIAQILPAATLPSQVVIADRYVNGGGDPNSIDQQDWDPSVKALARYPAVLKWMDDNLAWTTQAGEVFLNQQQDVMDSIQRLRAQAEALGNLQTTPQENVVADDGTIEILPSNPQMIYLPEYQPGAVYVQRAYGTPLVSFSVGLAIGAWLNHDFDWHSHHLIVWRHDAPRPPDWWSRRPSERPRAEAEHAAVWQPHNRPLPNSRAVDRGWQTPAARSTVTAIGAPSARAPRPAPPVIQHPTKSVPSRPANGALIGIQSPHQAQQFSARGQQSRQTAPRPPAPAHSAPPSRSTGPGKR